MFGSKVQMLLWSLDIVTQIRLKENKLSPRIKKGPQDFPVVSTSYSQRGRPPIFINESGIYSLVLSSKLEPAKKFKHCVTSTRLPSIRKYGMYKLFDSPHNQVIMIGNETQLHYKVVYLINIFYPDSLSIAGLGENQDTENKRLDSTKERDTREDNQTWWC